MPHRVQAQDGEMRIATRSGESRGAAAHGAPLTELAARYPMPEC
jgi:hypothetical protein